MTATIAMSLGLQINSEYQKLVRPLTAEEYNNLKADIQKEGKIYVPVIINKENIVLDGHHRCQIANELSISVPTKIVHFADALDEKEYVIKSNLNRRQLSVYDRAFLANELLKIKEERLRLKNNGGTKKSVPPRKRKDTRSKEDKARRRKTAPQPKAAKQHGISETTLRKYQTIIGSAPSKEKAEEIKHKLSAGQTTINKEYSSIKKEERKQALRNAEPLIDFSSDSIDLKYGDFIERSKEIPDNSIDLIFTDPPYAKTSDNDPDLYEEVAKMAIRLLKPGGSLVLYAAQHKLPQILEVMNVQGLTYWWILAVKHQGASARMHGQHVFIGWKPLLWFVKGTKLSTPEYISDFIESKEPSKESHEWEQSTEEAKYIISQLCPVENQVVLDPMLGAGTTGIATKQLGRKFIGIERDPIALDKARKNIFESSTS